MNALTVTAMVLWSMHSFTSVKQADSFASWLPPEMNANVVGYSVEYKEGQVYAASAWKDVIVDYNQCEELAVLWHGDNEFWLVKAYATDAATYTRIRWEVDHWAKFIPECVQE